MRETPDPERLAAARELYFDGKTSVAAVAASLGLNTSAFRKLRQQEGWPLRQNPVVARRTEPSATPEIAALPAPAGPPAPPGGAAAADDGAELTGRLERALAREVASFETSAEPDIAPAGRNARILASLVKTLAELRKLEAAPKSKRRQGMTHDGEPKRPPRDLAALREDLAKKLADFQRCRETS